jgi:hypothetical protein
VEQGAQRESFSRTTGGSHGRCASSRPYPAFSKLRHCAKSVKSAESTLKASDDPDKEQFFRDLLWEVEIQPEVVIESLKADCEVRTGRPPGL